MSASLFGDNTASSGPVGGSSQFNHIDPNAPRLYTKWYRVWERASPSDFKQEAFLIPLFILALLVHFWGIRKNRVTFRRWKEAHIPILKKEFTSVGIYAGDESSRKMDLLAIGPNECRTYATGRRNIAFVDVSITLAKRYNPVSRYGEHLLALFFETVFPTVDVIEAIAYSFDGHEKELSNIKANDDNGRAINIPKSTYEGCVWGVVRKDALQRLRMNQFDLSLTSFKDDPRVPAWCVILSESAEITDKYLTTEILTAVNAAGENLESLIISDLPTVRPTSADEFKRTKRITLRINPPSNNDYTDLAPLFNIFLRIPDFLISLPQFSPSVKAKLSKNRAEKLAIIIKEQEAPIKEQEAADRQKEQAARAEAKRADRDTKLRLMSVADQTKLLAQEEKKNMRKMAGKMKVMK